MKERQVRKAFLPTDIAVLAVILAAGCACFFFKGWSGIGIIILLCWALLIPFYIHGYRLRGQKGLFRLKEIPLSRENKDEILAFLDGKTQTLDLHPWQQGGVLVDVYTRKSDGLMLARYFDYGDFVNGIEYPLREITPGQVALLESFAVVSKKII